MQRVLDIFYEISRIPHCSGDTSKVKEYIVKFALLNGFKVITDESGNILARLSNPQVCLQSHYDMVCIGDANNIEIVLEKNLIRAKNSTLGADNGIGVAMMLALIEEKKDAEFLFTNDEEIGLIGAKNLKLDIRSRCLLNLDSEEEGKICIGCAGGFDIKVKIPLKKYSKNSKKPQDAPLKVKKVITRNFPGGHSGIEIDKNIPNAIKETLFFIKENNMTLLNLSGGERHNSIPVHIEAVVESEEEVESTEFFLVEEANKSEDAPHYYCSELASVLLSFPTGVRSWNSEHGIPQESVNLAMVSIADDVAIIQISARSMDNIAMKKLEIETREFFKKYEVRISDGYPAWKPQNSSFAKKVLEIYQQEAKEAQLSVIHAGLECAVLKEILGEIDAVSIGPNIFLPHTKKEYVEIDSVFRVFNIVKKIIG